MKKSLVLAMAMALGVTASAYAANPFSDVPAGHWAYDSVAKLAAAGVVDGYADGAFDGDKLITRYEMAQIVAKAMAKGADCDKLAAEFADELDTLGVRVAKLEKGADNVKITGNIRLNYSDYKAWGGEGTGAKMRSRIFINGQINDDWSYTGRIQNIQNFRNDKAEEDTDFNWAFVTGKLGGLDVRAGRTWAYLGDGNIYDETFDGVVLNYGKDVKVEAVYGKPTNAKTFGWDYDEMIGASVATKVAGLNVSAGYYEFGAANNPGATVAKSEDNKIWHAGANYSFGKANLGIIYIDSDLEDKVGGDGYAVTLNYGKARANKVGSFGLVAQYMDLPAGAVVAHTMNGNYPYQYENISVDNEGFDGYKLAGYYTVAKNMVAGVEYYDLDSEGGTKYETLWSQLIITF